MDLDIFEQMDAQEFVKKSNRGPADPAGVLCSYGDGTGVQGVGGMVIAVPGFNLLKSTLGLAALMALAGRPYMSAIVSALSPELST
jgi:hypothetical protein